MRPIIIPGLLILSCLMACMPDEDNSRVPTFIEDTCTSIQAKQVTLKKKTVTIQTPIEANLYSLKYRVFDSSKLIVFDGAHNTLNQYNLKDKKLTKSIPLASEGPDKINNLLDFYWHNQDSIFILCDHELLLVNDRGERIKKYLIDYQTDEGTAAAPYADPVLGLRLDYLPELQAVQFYFIFVEKSYAASVRKKMLVNFSLTQEQNITTFGWFPDTYGKGTYFSLFDDPSKITVGRHTILSFGADHGIYIYNALSGDFEEVECGKSQYLPNEIKGISLDKEDYQDMVNFETTAGLYLKILHDPFRNLFYRIVKHPQELKDENGQLSSRWGGAWSIIILDQSFNRIAEYKIEGSQINPLVSFVYADGLYFLSQLQNSEEKIAYEVLQFSQ